MIGGRAVAAARRWVRTGAVANGQHPDPLDPSTGPPDESRWPPAQRAAYASQEMAAFRESLLLPGAATVRDAVIDDLSAHHGIDRDAVVPLCIDWEAESVREWQAAEAQGGGPAAFYATTRSWTFDLLWYAYLQAEGHAEPQAVMALRNALSRTQGRRHLDFGSGAGTASGVFARFGFETTLADVSAPLLDFARFRLERRGVTASYRDLSRDPDLGGPYDVVTALDTLAHVPDVLEAGRALHGAMAPGGLLYAGIDARPATAENAWHLVDDEHVALVALRRAGFAPVERLGDQLLCWRRVDPADRAHRARTAVVAAATTSRAARAAQRAAQRGVRAAKAARGG